MKTNIELSALEYNYMKELWLNDNTDTISTKSITRKSKCFHRTTITGNNGKLVLEINNGVTKYWFKK